MEIENKTEESIARGKRLREQRKRAKLSQRDLGKLAGLSQGLICQIENGKPTDQWMTLAQTLEVSPNWLINGLGDPYARMDVAVVKVEDATGTEAHKVIYGLKHMDGNRIVSDTDVSMVIPRWLEDQFGINPASTVLFRPSDDAGAPERPKDCLLLVDTLKTEIRDASLYCIELFGQLTLRRIIIEPNNTLRLSCDNFNKSHHPDRVIRRDEMTGIKIIGQIVGTFTN